MDGTGGLPRVTGWPLMTPRPYPQITDALQNVQQISGQ